MRERFIPPEECEETLESGDEGLGIGVTPLFLLWFASFLALGLAWVLTRPRHRPCPRCGHDVEKGEMVCSKCGYDFVAPRGHSEAPPYAV